MKRILLSVIFLSFFTLFFLIFLYSRSIPETFAQTSTNLIVEYSEIDLLHGCSYYKLQYSGTLIKWMYDMVTLKVSTNEVIGKFGGNVSWANWEWRANITYNETIPNCTTVCNPYNETVWDSQNHTWYVNNYTNCTETCSSYIATKWRWDWLKNTPTNLNIYGSQLYRQTTSLGYTEVRFCSDIERERTANGWEIALDHIPEFAGVDYPNYQWWNSSWGNCKNITMNETSGINRTWEVVNVNITGLTFSSVNELRMVNCSCPQGGTQIQEFQILSSSASATGTGWANVYFEANITRYSTTDNATTYSIYYNNPTASPRSLVNSSVVTKDPTIPASGTDIIVDGTIFYKTEGGGPRWFGGLTTALTTTSWYPYNATGPLIGLDCNKKAYGSCQSKYGICTPLENGTVLSIINCSSDASINGVAGKYKLNLTVFAHRSDVRITTNFAPGNYTLAHQDWVGPTQRLVYRSATNTYVNKTSSFTGAITVYGFMGSYGLANNVTIRMLYFNETSGYSGAGSVYCYLRGSGNPEDPSCAVNGTAWLSGYTWDMSKWSVFGPNFVGYVPNSVGSNALENTYRKLMSPLKITIGAEQTSVTAPPQYSLNQTNSTTAGTDIQFDLYWTNTVLNKAMTSLWNGSSWVNATSWCSLSGATSWCNQTFRVNSTAQQLWWKGYANDSSNNWNTSVNFSLVTTGGVVAQTYIMNISQSISVQPVSSKSQINNRKLSNPVDVSSTRSRIIDVLKINKASVFVGSIIKNFKVILSQLSYSISTNQIINNFVVRMRSIQQAISSVSSSIRTIFTYRYTQFSTSVSNTINNFSTMMRMIVHSIDASSTSSRVSTSFRNIGQVVQINLSRMRTAFSYRYAQYSMSANNVVYIFSVMMKVISQDVNINSIIHDFSIRMKVITQNINISSISSRILTSFRNIKQSVSSSSLVTRATYIFKIIPQQISSSGIFLRIETTFRNLQQQLLSSNLVSKFKTSMNSIQQTLTVNSLSQRAVNGFRIFQNSIRTNSIVDRIVSSYRTSHTSIMINSIAVRLVESIRNLQQYLSSDSLINSFVIRMKNIGESLSINSIGQRIVTSYRNLKVSVLIDSMVSRTINAVRYLQRTLSLDSIVSGIKTVGGQQTILRTIQQSVGASQTVQRAVSVFREIQTSIILVMKHIEQWMYGTWCTIGVDCPPIATILRQTFSTYTAQKYLILLWVSPFVMIIVMLQFYRMRKKESVV